MENKGTGRVCLRALPFLMALSGICLSDSSLGFGNGEAFGRGIGSSAKEKDFRCRKRRNRRAGDWCFCTD